MLRWPYAVVDVTFQRPIDFVGVFCWLILKISKEATTDLKKVFTSSASPKHLHCYRNMRLVWCIVTKRCCQKSVDSSLLMVWLCSPSDIQLKPLQVTLNYALLRWLYGTQRAFFMKHNTSKCLHLIRESPPQIGSSNQDPVPRLHSLLNSPRPANLQSNFATFSSMERPTWAQSGTPTFSLVKFKLNPLLTCRLEEHNRTIRCQTESHPVQGRVMSVCSGSIDLYSYAFKSNSTWFAITMVVELTNSILSNLLPQTPKPEVWID